VPVVSVISLDRVDETLALAGVDAPFALVETVVGADPPCAIVVGTLVEPVALVTELGAIVVGVEAGVPGILKRIIGIMWKKQY
jgi:hypothetical protein